MDQGAVFLISVNCFLLFDGCNDPFDLSGYALYSTGHKM